MKDINYSAINPILQSQKLNNMVNHFWNRLQKENLCNLRETHKPNKLPIIEVNDIVIVHVNKLPRTQRKLGLVTELIHDRDTKVREAKLRLSRTNTIIIRPVNKIYFVERLKTNNTSASINKDTVQTNTRLNARQLPSVI